MSDQKIEIVFASGPGAKLNKDGLRRRMVLRVDDQDKDVVMVRLDSDQARKRQAKAWSEAFTIPLDDLEDKLRRASIVATAESQQYHPKVGGTESGGRGGYAAFPLDSARPVFDKWLLHVDPHLLDVVFGTIMAHRLDGDPVWMFIVGAPGDGKTESLRSLSDSDHVYPISTLTPGALISGYITEGPDPSLLPKIDGKVLIVKDFTAILEMPNEARSEVLGILRDCYDGEACKVFGTGETKRYRSRFGLLAAVTPVIDNYWGVSAQLGERFLRFRLPAGGRVDKTTRAMRNADGETGMRIELAEASMGVLAQDHEVVPSVPDHIEEKLIALADFVSLARSEVSRDRQGVIRYVPSPEVGTRVGKSLKKLSMGIAMARGVPSVDDTIYAIVRRVGLDTIPSMRAKLLGVLWTLRRNFEVTAVVADHAEVPTETAKTWLDDLRILGMIRRGGESRTGYTWNLNEEFHDTVVHAELWPEGGGIPTGGETYPPTEPLENKDLRNQGVTVGALFQEAEYRGEW